MLRRSIVAAVALLLVLATAPGAAAQAGGTERPFRMDLSTMIHWEFEAIAGCPVQTVMDGVGVATHLGLTRMHASHCPPMGPDEDYHDGRMTLTAADGDTLTLDYDGDPTSTAPAVITGGTGRFAGATGSLAATVVFTWAPWENGMPVPPWYAKAHYSGTVSY